ncbi:unnamed protein product [Leptosia nina]|uniref:Beta-glucosidase n=1 Tax=Leptosia nina TaxID=320188 RepID=A0AAV1J3N2_9NEOP
MFAASCNAAGKFPPGFRFGAATSSYQVEGAWNVSDKTPSVWDKFAHENPELISDRSNGDVACDSYHLWEEDVAIAKKIGLHFYSEYFKGNCTLFAMYKIEAKFDFFQNVLVNDTNAGPSKVGLTNNHIWYEAGTPDYEEKTELARNLAAIYAHPIYSKKGGWPANVEKYIKKKSKEEGYPRSKLPAFTREEIEFVRGTFDYYGINYYTSRLVFPEENITGPYNFWPIFGSRELGITLKPDPSWKAGHEWLVSYPAGLRKQLIWLVQQYGDIEIKILENGFSTRDREMNDLDRIEYYKDHLEQVLLSIKEDGLNITAYTAWSLMDNYEWIGGYTSKFGLTDVDFEDPKRKRTLRASASYYAAVIKKHSINV